MNILTETWSLLLSLGSNVTDMLLSLGHWLFSVFLILHNDMPRLEGLLVGIAFAWFFVHRDKNPIVRALAAPLKIVLDILDIIWDETIEAIGDLVMTVKEKALQLLGSVKQRVSQAAASIMSALLSVKNGLLSRFKNENNEEEKS